MLPHAWRRLFRTARLALALSCLVAEVFNAQFTVTEKGILFAAYTAYALIALCWKGLEERKLRSPRTRPGYAVLFPVVDLVLSLQLLDQRAFFFVSAAVLGGTVRLVESTGHYSGIDRIR